MNTKTQTHMVQGGVRLPSVSLTNTYTNMTDTLTPLQEELTTQLYTLRAWDDIRSFVLTSFPPASRRRVMTMLHSCPMDFDHIEWRGIVDQGIRKFL